MGDRNAFFYAGLGTLGLTEGDLWRLDIFEGGQYTREKVRVNLLHENGDEDGKDSVEGEEVEAETYVWADDRQNLEEGEWDFAEFHREKMQRWIGTNEEYAEVDHAIRIDGKDPTGGRGANGSITEQLNVKETDEALANAISGSDHVRLGD
ncbi:MAG: hypothetical protein Q9195_004286 [Heterodermia aff. obscurata]